MTRSIDVHLTHPANSLPASKTICFALNGLIKNIQSRINREGTKRYFFYYLGRYKGQRPATGDYIYVHPTSWQQLQHNKKALRIIQVKLNIINVKISQGQPDFTTRSLTIKTDAL